MPSKSKTKGNGFERDVCKYLINLTGLNFTRVPNSGAYVGKSNMVRAEHMTDAQIQIFDGDIITPDEFNEWALECKFYKSIGWKKLFQPEGEAKLNGWIEQSKITSKPYWLLIFKINNAGQYCVVSKATAIKFKFKKSDCFLTYRNDYLIMDMKSFFENNYKRMIK